MTGMGIVILVVSAIGIYSILRWLFTQASALSRKYFVNQPGRQLKPKKQELIRIGHERKLVCFDELSEANKYKGRTWLGGLPAHADVVVPDKHNYSTIIYMDHWFKQYVYDVMTNWKSTYAGFAKEGVVKSWFYILFFSVLFIIGGVSIGLVLFVACLFFAYILLGTGSSHAARRMGENAKDFTPEVWRKIYQDVAESKEREDELVRALRRSGVRRL